MRARLLPHRIDCRIHPQSRFVNPRPAAFAASPLCGDIGCAQTTQGNCLAAPPPGPLRSMSRSRQRRLADSGKRWLPGKSMALREGREIRRVVFRAIAARVRPIAVRCPNETGVRRHRRCESAGGPAKSQDSAAEKPYEPRQAAWKLPEAIPATAFFSLILARAAASQTKRNKHFLHTRFEVVRNCRTGYIRSIRSESFNGRKAQRGPAAFSRRFAPSNCCGPRGS